MHENLNKINKNKAKKTKVLYAKRFIRMFYLKKREKYFYLK